MASFQSSTIWSASRRDLWVELSLQLAIGNVRDDRLSRTSTLNESNPSRSSSADDAHISTTLRSLVGTPAGSLDAGRKGIFHEPKLQTLEQETLEFHAPASPPPPKNQERLSKNESRPSSIREDGHLHWSTVRESNRLYRTCDGFRRQENEREMHYVFMPEGPIEHSPHGHRCALCHIKQPDKEHLEYHNILQYMGSSKAPLKKSRKGEFVKLLKRHKVANTHIEQLVKKWHFIQKKKTYSCGLCVKLLSTLSERTSHMCHDYFAKGQNMGSWDDDKLIRGLLLQPELNKLCITIFAIDPSRKDSGFTWLLSVAKELQSKLELGRDTPYELASAAFEAAVSRRKPVSNHDVTAIGSRFPPRIAEYAPTPREPYQEALPASGPATNTMHSSIPALAFSDAQRDHHSGVYASTNSDGPQSTLLPSAMLTSVKNTTYPARTDSLAFNHSTQSLPPLYRVGGSFEEELEFEEESITVHFMDSDTYGGTVTDKEHGQYDPEAFNRSPFLTAHNGLPPESPSSKDAAPWPMRDQLANSRSRDATVRLSVPVFAPTPKRKFSDNTAAVAQGKPATISPMEARAGTRSFPINLRDS